MIPLFLVVLYMIATTLVEFSFTTKLIFLAVLTLAASAVIVFLYKSGQITKQRLMIFLVFVGISIAFSAAMYFYTAQL